MRLARKQFRDIRRGRISALKEVRRQQRIRNNLEKQLFRRLTSLFRKFARTKAFLYQEFGVFDLNSAIQDLNEELLPTMFQHYRKVFTNMYASSEEIYNLNRKQDEVFVMGRSVDFEAIVSSYYAGRTLVLSGISERLANRVNRIIIQGREENLTLTQIAQNIASKVTPITRGRAATIARTETHNAASFANHSYYQTVQTDLGMSMVKKWVSTSDLRTRSAHSAANGQTRSMDEDFIIGGTPMGYAGDPKGGAKNVINCRCVIIYADEQDVVSD